MTGTFPDSRVLMGKVRARNYKAVTVVWLAITIYFLLIMPSSRYLMPMPSTTYLAVLQPSCAKY